MSEIRRVWIQYGVYIDWEADNWAGTHDFSQEYDDITSDVKTLSWGRGKQREAGNAPAATLEIGIKSAVFNEGTEVMKYSPFSGMIPGMYMRPWLPVKVVALGIKDFLNETVDDFTEVIPIYYGYVSSIRVNPHPSILSASFYCTDGTDLLARQIITQNPANKEICDDGRAVEKILDAAGWNLNRRRIDRSGGNDLLAYPACHPY